MTMMYQKQKKVVSFFLCKSDIFRGICTFRTREKILIDTLHMQHKFYLYYRIVLYYTTYSDDNNNNNNNNKGHTLTQPTLQQFANANNRPPMNATEARHDQHKTRDS